MSGIFASPRMAAGYAKSRPELHSHIIKRIAQHLGLDKRVSRALDVGCGAGLSTAPLESIAESLFGVDLAHSMLRCAPSIVPKAHFAGATLEALPFRDAAFDIVTAAGSLNWADLDLFFPEAARVFAEDGLLIVYDFSQGRCFRDSDALDLWFTEFLRRYPAAAARRIDPESMNLRPFGLQLTDYEVFKIGLPLTADFYTDYAMTETNVEQAVNGGVAEAEIREWCQRTIADAFGGLTREVLFDGYIAYITVVGR